MAGVYTKKVLIVEDDQSIVGVLAERLRALGYETLIVADETQALAELRRVHPELLLLDVGMTAIDGFALLESIRGNPDPRIAQVPVIIGSHSGDLVEIGRALKLGINDYFVKTTFDVDALVLKIQTQLGSNTTPQKKDKKGLASVSSTLVNTKILIIEDDKFLRDLAIQKLSKEHLQVVTAVDGEQGIVVAERELPDIILLDILLPGIDGFEVLKRLRSNPVFAKTRVAMLSNFGQREDIDRALHAGADQFFIKANYTLDEIVEEIKKMIANPRT